MGKEVGLPSLTGLGWPKYGVLGAELLRRLVVNAAPALNIIRRVAPRQSDLARPSGVALLLPKMLRPQVRRGYPLSLSISISGGKETYKDSLSNGERTGNSSALESGGFAF